MNISLLHFSATVGTKIKQISRGLDLLNMVDGVDILEVSSFYESEEIDGESSMNRISRACQISTILTTQELIEAIKRIEKRMNVSTSYNWEESQLVILLISYNEDIICDDHVTIPYPLTHLDGSLLVPIKEIAPQYVHPVIDESIESIYFDKVG